MTHEEARESLLADRYVMGRLTLAEATRFEEHFLSCQACLDDLEATERLQRAMKRSASHDATEIGVRLGLLAWLTRRGSQLPGIAVLVLVAGFAAFSLGRTAAPRPVPVPSAALEVAPQANVPLLFLSPERSAADTEPSHRVLQPPAPIAIILVLELEPPLLDSYEALLYRSDTPGEPLWRGAGLVPNELDALSISLPSSLLEPSDWIVRVESPAYGDEPSRPVALFPFRVTSAP